MKLINVIPISRGIGKETLSYFSGHDIPEGSIVNVPLRKKEVPAIVISSEDIQDAKTKIKRANFQIKKISSQKPITLLTPQYIRAAKETANYFASTTGSVLHNLIPKSIIENKDYSKKLQNNLNLNKKTAIISEKLVLQAPFEERLTTYRSFIREEFARNASVFLMASSIVENEYLFEHLRKGIEHRTFLFHGSLTKKEMQARWKAALDAKQPILIVGTGSFLSIPRDDIETIIIERENANSYKQIARPFLDQRVFAEFLAREINARIVFAGLPLRIETLWRYRNSEYDDLAPLKMRLPAISEQMIVDMRNLEKDKEFYKKKKFELFGKEVKNILKTADANKERIFIFTARRGLSPTTVCNDCNDVVLCSVCDAPVILHKSTEKNIFLCTKCGSTRSAKECCKTCGSWKLMPLGIGIQRVEEELRKQFSKKTIITIDRDSTKTHKQALAAAEKFYTTQNSILIGTEMALQYMRKPVEHTIIASMDSLLLLPEWRIGEKLFAILLSIRTLATKNFIIQTRKPEYNMLEYALRGNLSDFYKDEIEQRKTFNYPPFCILIKFTCTGSALSVKKEIKKLEKLFHEYAFHCYHSSIHVSRGRFIVHGLLRIKKETWPDTKLLALLYTIPPNIAINVDPESLF